jgi:hypothetical protein
MVREGRRKSPFEDEWRIVSPFGNATLAVKSELAEWGISEALPWLWQELAGIVVDKRKLAPMRPNNAIVRMLPRPSFNQ